jgi:hypothetical protein
MLVRQRIIASPLIPWVNFKRELEMERRIVPFIFRFQIFFTGISSSSIAITRVIDHGDPGGKEMDLQDKAPM